ncbi:hypothetical protein B7486_08945 [cyanobacterium TDX16]|nr:hypothetical protein B7486_08945 [cyanobacterium TDX16]
MTSLESFPEIAAYDESLQRYTFGCSGFTGDFATDASGRVLDAISYQIWVSVPSELQEILRERLTLQCLASYCAYGLEGTERQERNASIFSFLFSIFIQGTILGWRITEESGLIAKPTSIIRVHEKIQQKQPLEILERLGELEKTMRRMCLADWLAFYCDNYDRFGPSRQIPPIEFTKSGFCRVSYPKSLVNDTFDQLSLEHWLAGTRGGRFLEPSMVSAARSRVNTELRAFLDSVLDIGQWLEIPSTNIHKTPTTHTNHEPSMPIKRVFIIHGHDEARWRELRTILEERFHFKVSIMQELPGKSRTLIEKFEEEAAGCDAAIAVLTPDDIIESHGEPYGQPRPNVIYELGWFAGRCSRSRTLMIVQRGTEIPSDLGGIERIEFVNTIAEVILKLEKEIQVWKNNINQVDRS